MMANVWQLTACVLLLVAEAHSKYTYQIEYLTLPVDHFSFANDRVFRLRYLINDTYWLPKKTGPIFLYTGNEGVINMFAQNSGFLWECAERFNALIVFAEHRYYGDSLPFGNKSFNGPEYTGFLTTEQALADFVDVVYHVKYEKYRLRKSKMSNPVIAFGGSYGGMLAAWMRMKYPAVIEGALSSSAPIWYFSGMISCNAFNKQVTFAYNYSSPVCVDNIRESWKTLKRTWKKASGKLWLRKNWKLCKPVKKEDDFWKFMYWLRDLYGYVAMINYPYPTNFLTPVPANPVKKMCKFLKGKRLKNKKLLKAVFNAAQIYFNYTGNAKCLDWSSDASSDLGMQGWEIQSCTEMVMPFCSNGKTDMFFPEKWDFKALSDACFEKLRLRPDEFRAEKIYGGKNLGSASNIIFSNGEFDPWSVGGVTSSNSPNINVIHIEKSAHHLDLRDSNENDPKSVLRARRLYINIFKKWINEYRKRQSSSNDKIVYT